MNFIQPGDRSPFDFMDFIYVDGHTEKMMLPRIRYKNETIVYCADLMPSVYHIPVPWVMAYDTRPLLTMKEKAEFLDLANKESYTLFFEHDHQNQCCNLQGTDRGVRLQEAFPLSEIL